MAQSEYPSSPIVAIRTYTNTKYVAGWGATHLCSSSVGQYSETMTYKFPSCSSASLKVDVTLSWSSGSTTTTLSIVATSYNFPWSVYFGDTLVCSVSSGQSKICSTGIARGEGKLASNRHTIRHGSQIAKELFQQTGDTTSATYLTNFLTSKGFNPNWDIYIPLFRTVNIKDDYFYDYTTSDGDPTPYYDCFVSYGIEGFRSYEYQSKVCVIGVQTYTYCSGGDALVPTLQAIHILNKYNSKTRTFNKPTGAGCAGTFAQFTGWSSGTPQTVASALVGVWNGFAIPHPSDTSIGSMVRTAAALVLWSKLCWQYGDTGYCSYAHAAASTIVAAQVKSDRIVRFADGTTYYRPGLEGSFYLGFNQLKYRAPSSWFTAIADLFNMPEEYTGVKTSNVESTAAAVQALRVYLQLRGG